jgi:hypothetical protein
MNEPRILDAITRVEKVAVRLGRKRIDPQGLAWQIRNGLDCPVEFPSLRDFVIAGDRIVVAVHSGLGSVELLLDPFLNAFDSIGGQRDQITLLFAERSNAERFRQESVAGKTSEIVVHEGVSDSALALLGGDDDDQPILIDRWIFDADLMIPFAPARRFGDRWPMMMDFVDSATRTRCRRHEERGDFAYADHDADLAGVLVAVLAVMGPGGFAYDVVVGRPQGLADSIEGLHAAAWAVQPDPKADLVIAVIEDSRDRRTWQAIRDATIAASEASDNAEIIVVSDDRSQAGSEARESISGQPARQSGLIADAELRRMLSGRSVFLYAPWTAGIARDLGWRVLDGVDDVLSRVEQSAHPVVYRDPQRVAPQDSAKNRGGPSQRATTNSPSRRKSR